MTDKPELSRRHFMSSILGSTVAIATTTSLKAAPIVSEQQPEQKVEQPKSAGYQRTEHVDTYYHLADF